MKESLNVQNWINPVTVMDIIADTQSDKLCKDCKHSRLEYGQLICDNPKILLDDSYLSKNRKYFKERYCSSERLFSVENYPKRCSVEGIFFEQKFISFELTPPEMYSWSKDD